MSGGSFDYLCFAEPSDLHGKTEDIKRMADYLTDHRYLDASADTKAVLRMMRRFERRMEARLKRLRPVWKAVEWHTSGDCNGDRVAEVMAAYRVAGEEQVRSERSERANT